MKRWSILLLGLLPLWAQALEIGERLAPWTLLDQYDQAYSLDSQAKVLLVARSMDAAKVVNAALKDQPKGYLQARHGIFVADIQRMPTLIAKMFAVPAMRDYPYRVMLDRDGRVVPRYPGAEDKVLWLQLQEGQLVGRQEYATAEQLAEALERLQP
ncbi:FAD/FMN-containing dehydrogenase [Pseudomonas sp. Fl5BN2]|uniref:FAD/FMN-containing dehydrogenase n=1 Tax=Pseudomonas sp. Fl5BN2 TaxID=2697652 RepID=UPI001378167D|nr:FAD/FMN-containing dehydrogenase [Pseudomonas sp. Fl5BN2]